MQQGHNAPPARLGQAHATVVGLAAEMYYHNRYRTYHHLHGEYS